MVQAARVLPLERIALLPELVGTTCEDGIAMDLLQKAATVRSGGTAGQHCRLVNSYTLRIMNDSQGGKIALYT